MSNYLVTKPVRITHGKTAVPIDVEGVEVMQFLPMVDTLEKALKIAGGKEELIIELNKEDKND